MEIYVVRPNDTIDKIAQQQGADVNSIIEINQLTAPYRLAVGQSLLFSGRTPQQAELIRPSRGRSVFRSGYAYPFIASEVMEETLSWLTEVAVFS